MSEKDAMIKILICLRRDGQLETQIDADPGIDTRLIPMLVKGMFARSSEAFGPEKTDRTLTAADGIEHIKLPPHFEGLQS